jgi:hypothetical protein
MVVKNTNVNQQPEILKRLLGGELFVPVTIATASFTNGVCKAGTPIDESGAIANDANAKGILLYDVYEQNPNGSLVVAYATINLANAEANSGLTIADAVKTTLANVTFE